MHAESDKPAGELLSHLLEEAGMSRLKDTEERSFEVYLSLFVRWNSRINLSSVRASQQILSRHFVESIACARSLPEGISTLLDFGSGGGLPGIPIAICRPELRITLAESQSKKSAFLREAVRNLHIEAEVFSGRAETLERSFDCVTLRAVDKMKDAVGVAAQLVAQSGWLALMTTEQDVATLESAADQGFTWRPVTRLPASESRVLAMAQRAS